MSPYSVTMTRVLSASQNKRNASQLISRSYAKNSPPALIFGKVFESKLKDKIPISRNIIGSCLTYIVFSA